MSEFFEWYTGFEDFLTEGIAESCYWIRHKKYINQIGLDDEVIEEGMNLLRIFVNDRASLYRYRDELEELSLSKAKAYYAGNDIEVVKLGAREKKIRDKALLTVWKILDHRQEFDDWMGLEGVDPLSREKGKEASVDYEY